MARSPLILLVLMCTLACIRAETVPVLMWGSGSETGPALNDNPQAAFLRAVTKSPLTLVFVEQVLTAEDISLCKVGLEGSCFNYLANLGSKSYVQTSQPVDRIEDVAENVQYVHVGKDGKLDSEIPFKKASVVVLYLDEDAELSRAENLEKHDAYIQNIYNNVVSNVGKGQVLALYTGKTSGTLVRKARQVATTTSTTSTIAPPIKDVVTTEAPSKDVKIFSTPELLVYYTSLTFTDKQNSADISVTGLKVSNKNDSSFLVTMSTSSSPITFTITNSVYGYWTVTDVKYDKYVDFTTDRTVQAADGFSYYCGPATVYTIPGGQSLTFINLQLEPTFGNSTKEMTRFNDPYNCVGFTSIPIWSGLFVSVVLLLILSIGLTWLMDVKTMDRFDDPKGKTISVNTME